MSNQVDKQSGAMRIFEALSSVDEELLERSEEKTKVLPFRKATRIMAACASLLVVGLVTWTGVQYLGGGDKFASDLAAPESMNEMEKELKVEATVESATVTQDSISGANAEEGAGETHGAMWDCESVMVQNQKELSWEELRAVEVLGEYVPAVVPEGYLFESGYMLDESEIHICWSKGMDTIMLTVMNYEDRQEVRERIVDISKPETYDVHLYEIPYADTVPEEYRAVFSNPIFRENDLTAEVVQTRMKSVADAGDTDTPRGNFAVLYESGVLVRFNGDGSPMRIWEMFESIGE